MKLTEEQVKQLFAFCEKKYVRYYDLQVELVDHLAERIEEEMSQDPKLAFEAARDKVYKGFGLFGFAHIVRDREIELGRQNKKLWWKELLSYFTWPRIVLSATIFLVFFTLGELLTPSAKAIVAFLCWTVCNVFFYRDMGKYRKKEKKSLMLTMYYPASSMIAPVFIFEQLLIFGEEIRNNFLFAAITMFCILFQLIAIELNKRMYTKARELYPLAFS
jgi:hypothetical protein